MNPYQSSISYPLTPNGVLHQPHDQYNMIRSGAAFKQNSIIMMYPSYYQGNACYTIDPKLIVNQQPIDDHDSPSSESTYDFSHLSPSSNDASVTEEQAIFDYCSGDDNSCSPYDTEQLYPNVSVVDPSDPITANTHVPSTLNGDPNLLIDQIFGIGSPLSSVEDEVEEDGEEADTAIEQEDIEEQEQEEEKQEEVDEEEEKEEEKPVRSRKRKAEESSAGTSTTTTKRRKKVAAKVFNCPFCAHSSKRKYNLTTHMKTHDNNRVKEFICSQCQKGFDRRHDRNRHLATVHRLERAHVCNHCPAHFSRGDALNRHLIHKHGYDEAFED
ncbi:hypothetical protein HPULCUR_009617 [Helicostylum pulchrum]|uniref:C2H2-type domain-containing protein n=1 Tax=Helicostylum pulchrum TaxID=562976 RepID=A0ABP9YAZ3_9FUNG